VNRRKWMGEGKASIRESCTCLEERKGKKGPKISKSRHKGGYHPGLVPVNGSIRDLWKKQNARKSIKEKGLPPERRIVLHAYVKKEVSHKARGRGRLIR